MGSTYIQGGNLLYENNLIETAQGRTEICGLPTLDPAGNCTSPNCNRAGQEPIGYAAWAVDSLLRYRFPMASLERSPKGSENAAAAEAIRVQRLQEDAQRPISTNLAETIALSHKLLELSGAARRE